MLAFAPLDGAVQTAAVAVSTIAAAATPLAGANATALAIVGFTVAIRLAVSPLSLLQARAERRRAALAPRLRELQRRVDDPDRLRVEMIALHRSAGTSPFGGCLPALLQAPFFLVMYRLATHPPGGSGLLRESLFGVPLGHHLADGLAGAAGPVFAVLFGLLAGLAWWLSRRIRRATAESQPAGGAGPAGGSGAAGASQLAGGSGPAGGLARVVPLLPYGTLLVAAIAPLAAGLYLLTTTAWTALERVVFARR